jgi:predicted nucleic acid-binding protein
VIVVDTTVLVYAVGAEHPLRDPCRALMGALARGELRASTTPEVLQEFAHVRARRRDRADAVVLTRAYAALLAPLLVADAADLAAGLDLFERHDRLGVFDAVLAAVALSRGADGLVSADQAFAGLRGLPHLDPAHDNFAERLTGRP